MPDTQPVTRAPADQLLLDLADRWLYRHDETTALAQAGGDLALIQLGQAITAGGLAVIYLLTLLRKHAPDIADRAVPWLVDDPDAWPADWLADPRSRVVDLIDALLAGHTPAVPLAPAPDQA